MQFCHDLFVMATLLKKLLHAWLVFLDTAGNCLTEVQVNGLPTNQAFLKRLAVHPAFQAAELDTSFIQKHHASLTDTEAPPQHVTALAAVADHLLQVHQV